VDFIKPVPHPPWKDEPGGIDSEGGDLIAAEIEGLVWLQNAAPFEAVAIDDTGQPLLMVVPDPRVFAIHKLWLSKRPDRDPLKRPRDRAQAVAVGQMVTQYLPHLS
jgi:hypothetical protein